MQTNRDYYKVSELARLLEVDKKTVYKWIKDRRINAIRACGIIRIHRDEVDRLLEGKNEAPKN